MRLTTWLISAASFCSSKRSKLDLKEFINQSELELTKTLAEVCLFVNEDFSRDDVAKGHKHLE